jgi:membrane-bound lytic murein transglycosylase A
MLLILLLITLNFFGLHNTLNASDFIKVKDPELELPTIQIDGDFNAYLQGIENILQYCKQNPSSKVINFDGTNISRNKWCIKTGEKLLELSKDTKNFTDFYNKIKKNFNWYKSKGSSEDNKIKFTGYYSPILKGSRTQTSKYKYPIYKTPKDLVFLNGKWMRKEGHKYLPYYTRKEIDLDKKLEGKNLEIVYVEDPFELSIFQVQGAGVIELEESGKKIFLNYAAQNGQRYRALRSIMKERGISDEFLTMQGMRRYFKMHPDELLPILYENPSYVFFKEEEVGPVGVGSTLLIPEHSIAIDPKFNPLFGFGLIKTKKPVFDEQSDTPKFWEPILRLVISNDVGGAIRGRERVDFFWGEGIFAELASGAMNNEEGELYFLVAKDFNKK